MKSFSKLLTEATKEKETKLSSTDPKKKKLSKITYEISKIKWQHPIDALKELQKEFKPLGIVIVQEDSTIWSGMFSKGKAGKENSTKFNIAYITDESDNPNHMHNVIKNCVLVFSWYCNDDNSKCEVNCYIS